MKARVLSFVLAACLASIGLCGCGTTRATTSGIMEPFAGSKLDTYIFSSPDASTLESVGAAVDYPFSIVADTVLLVFTVGANPQRITHLEYD